MAQRGPHNADTKQGWPTLHSARDAVRLMRTNGICERTANESIANLSKDDDLVAYALKEGREKPALYLRGLMPLDALPSHPACTEAVFDCSELQLKAWNL